jgi:hypothetical protein
MLIASLRRPEDVGSEFPQKSVSINDLILCQNSEDDTINCRAWRPETSVYQCVTGRHINNSSLVNGRVLSFHALFDDASVD